MPARERQSSRMADYFTPCQPRLVFPVLQQDHYQRLSDIIFRWKSGAGEIGSIWSSPDTILVATRLFALIEHVRQLREGNAIDRPVYDFTKHRRSSSTVRMNPYPAMILEGILIFENKALRDLMDIKIFVDTDADLRFIRRLGRDIRERGRTAGSSRKSVDNP